MYEWSGIARYDTYKKTRVEDKMWWEKREKVLNESEIPSQRNVYQLRSHSRIQLREKEPLQFFL